MEQRDEQWHSERAVRITASRFGDVLANPNTKRYRYYMDDIIDALHGFKKFPKETPWFDHGTAWEAEARGEYAWKMDCDVDVPALIVHPKYDFISYSPDGHIGTEGGLEIKCHKSLKEFRKSEKGMPSNHKPQVQGSLWISGYEQCDFVSYYRNFDGTKRLIHIHPVEPDLKYHKRLESACLDFWAKVQAELEG